MATDPNHVDQAVSRALRGNLARIQHDSEELQYTINDLVSACASSRPTNAWPAMVRGQALAASVSASLEVLMRFVAATVQASVHTQVVHDVPAASQSFEPPPPAEPAEETPAPQAMAPEPIVVESLAPEPLAPEAVVPESAAPNLFLPQPLTPQPTGVDLPLEEPYATTPEEPFDESPEVLVPPSAEGAGFNVSTLPIEVQEMHRRAYRVAKVAMQDIKLIQPGGVRDGRENKDLCVRLRVDIEKAHTEYVRRFEPILSHPVDYFYDWMVEILAEGDPTALGEYPYPSAVLHR